MADKKTSQEASNIFHSIMKASVKPVKADKDEKEKSTPKLRNSAMSPFRPKDKFDYYSNAIGESLYLIIFCAAILFLIGFAFYELYIGDYKWFKENPSIFLVFIIVTAVGIVLLRDRKKR